MGTLWASQHDRDRLAEARSAVLLVGGYDGSGNYGDVLQLATAIATVDELPGSPLPVAVVERETRGYHATLVERYPELLAGAVYLHFEEGGEPPDDELVAMRGRVLPGRTALYIYGGGFLNHRWGARKIAHAAAAEALARRRPLPLVASGLQVDEPAVERGGVAFDLLARASRLGVRDVLSQRLLEAHLPAPAARRVSLDGDDAVPFLQAPSLRPEPTVNLHLNDGVWVSEDSEEMAARIASLLEALGRSFDGPLRLQPVVAYEDPRVSEREVLAAFLRRHGAKPAAASIAVAEPLDLLDDAARNELARFRRARLTVACSYHVTLSSLLAGIPAVLLAENDYYEQKAAGLRDLFDLDGRLIGVGATPGNAADAVAALVDGEPREALLAHLSAASGQVIDLYRRGRQSTSASLSGSLRGRSPFGVIRRLIGGG